MICKFCGRTCDSLRSLAQHQLLCKLNPDRRPHTGGAKRGRKAWNRGLKKSTSESVKKYSETISKNYSGENSPWYGKHHTEETKMDQFPEHEKLIVIDKHGISEYLNYAEDKYGKEFIKLYDRV